ncbi:amidohydrolase family protein [bacterium]|nr:amidohydrolase family protein [bacterium]
MPNCIHAKKIYTGKKIVENAYVVFEGEKVRGISTTKKGKLVGRFDTITPAFIDPHSHIGMLRQGEPGEEAEANEHLDSLMTLPDALDSVQMDDAAFPDAVEQGVLYSCVLPGSGNIIAGRSAVIRNFASNTNEALVARAGIKAAFGYNPMSTVAWKGKRPSTRMGALSILRGRFDAVKEKIAKQKKTRGKSAKGKKDEVTFTSEEAVLRDLLLGKERLRVHVHKIDDIAALLRIVDEYKLKITVEHAGDVHEPGIFQELAKRKIPVLYGPIDAFAYKVELKHESWKNTRYLIDSGVECSFMTDHPVTPARTLFLQTRWFVRCGYDKQQAIELITRKSAEILGIDDKLGTLARGKWASFTCWNGDPFDTTCYPVAVYGEGRLVFEDE